MWLLNPYWYTKQYSAPVSDYLDRVIAADVAAGNLLGLEDGTKTAYATFIDNLIVDGYLGVTGGTISQASSVMKTSPIMAGARTLAGALIPLAGTAPTRFGTEGGWNYSRKTGLQGNGTDNYLNSNRANNADPQDSKHIAVFVTSAPSGSTYALMGSLIRTPATSVTQIFHVLGGVNTGTQSSINSMLNFIGISRSNSANQVVRSAGVSTVATSASNAHHNLNAFIFARNDGGGVNSYANARIAFYSIGESLDLALLDFRVTALRNALAAAIP